MMKEKIWSWYSDVWAADQRCFVLPYIGINSSKRVWMRTVYNYTSGDWIFWTKVTVVADDKRFTESYSYFDVTRDNSGGRVWEYYDDESYIDMLRAIAAANNTVVRLEGREYYYDFTLSSTDKNAIKKTLELYDALVDSGVYKKY